MRESRMKQRRNLRESSRKMERRRVRVYRIMRERRRVRVGSRMRDQNNEGEQMDRNASSSSKGVANGNVILCYCNTPAKILKAWTDANPGRRFYACGRGPKVGSKYGTCNFFRWFDMEKPSGWQYHALLEARDLIREQKDEIRRLKIQRNCEAERIDTKNPSEIVAEFLLNLSN